MERRRIWIDTSLLILPGMLLLLIATLAAPAVMRWHLFDLHGYATASARLLQGQIPYRDFALEYPPLALLPFVLPRLLAFNLPLADESYGGMFGFTNVLYSGGITLILAASMRDWPGGSRRNALLVYAVCVAILAPLLPWRYDLFPALLTAGALLAVLRERALLAGVLLGLGVAAKLYPLVIIAAVCVVYLARNDWRSIAWLALGSAGAVAVVLLPFLVLAPNEMFSFLSYHEQRGLQLESVAGGLVVLIGMLARTREQLAFNFGALHLDSPLAAAMLGWLLPLFVGVLLLLLALWFIQFRREYQRAGTIRTERIVACVVSALLVFIVTNKVFSPQYVIWLLPFIPLLRAPQRVLLILMLIGTITLFPFVYERLQAFEVLPVLLLNGRNLLAIACIPWLLLDGRLAAQPLPRARALASEAQ